MNQQEQHDRLCRVRKMPAKLYGVDPQYDQAICECDLIARVRIDERAEATCPCGDSCEKTLAECCGEDQFHCETRQYQDFRLCAVGEGCDRA
jgi:hypothetical protein